VYSDGNNKKYFPPHNTIKLSILKKFGAGTLVPFYGTEVPTPWVKKVLNLMAMSPLVLE
jgi:hypothetical protein